MVKRIYPKAAQKPPQDVHMAVSASSGNACLEKMKFHTRPFMEVVDSNISQSCDQWRSSSLSLIASRFVRPAAVDCRFCQGFFGTRDVSYRSGRSTVEENVVLSRILRSDGSPKNVGLHQALSEILDQAVKGLLRALAVGHRKFPIRPARLFDPITTSPANHSVACSLVPLRRNHKKPDATFCNHLKIQIFRLRT